MNFNNISPGRLKIPLLCILAAILLSVSALIFFKARVLVNPIFKNINIDSSADILLNNFKHISKTNGIKEWALKAASAKIINDKNLAVLNGVAATIFTEDNKEIYITAKNGKLNTETHDIELYGNVIIRFEGVILKTDKLHYSKNSHIIYSDESVTITKEKSTVQADSLVADLKAFTLELKGNIKGNFFKITTDL